MNETVSSGLRSVGIALAVAAGLLPLYAAPENAPPANALKRIQARFVAPCCWQDNLATHNSGAAEEMRAEIAAMAAAGKTEAQIVDHYTAIYGERILREPRGKKSVVLVVVPVLALAAGGAWLARYLSRARQRRTRPLEPSTVPPVPDDEIDW